MKSKIALILTALIFCTDTHAQKLESFYTESWCRAQPDFIDTEVRVDGGRVDCVLNRYAVEVERAYKWKEGIAQARWYAYKMNKIPAIVLILRNEKDARYEKYIEEYAHKYKFYIKLWRIYE